jgi:hypothetical protein
MRRVHSATHWLLAVAACLFLIGQGGAAFANNGTRAALTLAKKAFRLPTGLSITSKDGTHTAVRLGKYVQVDSLTKISSTARTFDNGPVGVRQVSSLAGLRGDAIRGQHIDGHSSLGTAPADWQLSPRKLEKRGHIRTGFDPSTRATTRHYYGKPSKTTTRP